MNKAQIWALTVAAGAAHASPSHVNSAPSFKDLPIEARSVIRDAEAAAQRRDTQALRTLMAPSFRWNLGPDGETHDAAVRAWLADPDYLRQMVSVLRKGCVLMDLVTISCPGAGGTSFRAGFQRTGGGWKMTYFLAGD